MAEDASTPGEVVAALDKIAAELPPADGLKWFALIYSEATKAVVAGLERGEFESPAFMPHLVIRFFNAFDDSLSGRQMLSNAWLPVFEARYDPGIAPLQFAVAGYNSQMGYEMPLGLVAAWRDSGVTPARDSAEHRDYERLNAIVGEVHPRVRDYLRSEAVEAVGRRFDGVDEIAARWNHEDERAKAWQHGVELCGSWDDHARATARLAEIDRDVGAATKRLLEPTGA